MRITGRGTQSRQSPFTQEEHLRSPTREKNNGKAKGGMEGVEKMAYSQESSRSCSFACPFHGEENGGE